jgi:hypothetical protein
MRKLHARWAVVPCAIVLVAIAGLTRTTQPAAAQSAPFCARGESPTFVFGFAALREQVGDAMGAAIECEHANPDNGDTLQQTTTGLSFYRKSTNTPTFTDGFDHWGLTSDGLVTWTGSSIDPPGVNVPQTAVQQPPAAPPLPTPTSTLTRPPTNTPVPTPTNTLVPTSTAIPAARPPIDLQGRGQTATNPVTPPSSISVVTLTHSGKSNFIVHALTGSEENHLVNEIGTYQGQRPLFGTEPVTFDIDADGPWTIHMEPIRSGGGPPFQGNGDAVSSLFTPPASGPWEISHSGKRNFIVHLYCNNRTTSVQNEIGVVQASRVVQFGQGPCFWEVIADGAWSLRPR